ncbi:glycine-rich protein-like [Schistocerca piceifrons]|uniref:glycine-rich protein-like n=1 Tax=Schistocerca piceifrons TaxID=274613 RepID=UPI001F5FEAF1|nr:glycine-rich protein-like [Schistocerca piceifrons]
MKLLLVVCAVLALAVARPGYLGGAAGYYGAPALAYGGYGGYAAYGPAFVAVGPGGYLVDTPEVAAARSAHFAAVAETKARDAAVNAADAAHAGYGAYGLGYGLHGLGYGYHH